MLFQEQSSLGIILLLTNNKTNKFRQIDIDGTPLPICCYFIFHYTIRIIKVAIRRRGGERLSDSPASRSKASDSLKLVILDDISR